MTPIQVFTPLKLPRITQRYIGGWDDMDNCIAAFTARYGHAPAAVYRWQQYWCMPVTQEDIDG